MTGAEFCALPEQAKQKHVAGLTDVQRRALVDSVATHHAAQAVAQEANTDPFRLRMNRRFREFASALAAKLYKQ